MTTETQKIVMENNQRNTESDNMKKTKRKPMDKAQKIFELNAKIKKIEDSKNEQIKKLEAQRKRMENEKTSVWQKKSMHIKFLFGAYSMHLYDKNPEKRESMIKDLKDYITSERENEHIDYFNKNYDEMKQYSKNKGKSQKRVNEKMAIEKEQAKEGIINEQTT